MKYPLVILDNGHGGIIDGKPVTAGKRSPDGTLIEGVFNRDIVNGIAFELYHLGIPVFMINPEQEDMPLANRVDIANAMHKAQVAMGGSSIMISVHGNAGGGTGFEAYTSYGKTKADDLASIIYGKFIDEFPDELRRTDYSDNDPDKEYGFFMLRRSMMPAVLTENFFMDTEHDYQIMTSPEGRKKIINYHVEAIKEYVKYES